MKPKFKKHRDEITTQGQLAKLVGRDPAQVSRWVRRADWKFGNGPWKLSQVPEILAWVADILKESEVGGASELLPLKKQKIQAEIQRIVATTKTVETALAKERGELVPAIEVKQWIGQHVITFRNRLLALGARITTSLEGCDAAERQRIIETEIGEILTSLANEVESAGQGK